MKKRGRITKIPEKETKVSSVSGKEKTSQESGYRDPYSKKVYESKEAFIEMKLSHEKAKYTILFKHMFPLVEKGQKEILIMVSDAGLDWIDKRLPVYILDHMKTKGIKLYSKNAENYKVSLTPTKDFKKEDLNETKVKGLVKFTLVKK